MRINKVFIHLLFVYLLFFAGCYIDNNNGCYIDNECVCEHEYIKNTDWTVMHYLASDSGRLESDLCKDIEEIVNGYRGGCNVLVLIDVGASEEYSIYDQSFSGTCIFRAEENKLARIDLHDVYSASESSVDSADPDVLRAFISYCKENYPAKYYGLFLGGHGGGVSSTIYQNTTLKNILYDGDTKRWICAVDLTNNLDGSCSVDLLGLDLCYMGCVEFLYQIRKGNGRFSADYAIASAPEVWGEGLNYFNIYENFAVGITPKDLSCRIVKCQSEYIQQKSSSQIRSIATQARAQSVAAYDLSEIDNLKQKFDELCNLMTDKKATAQGIRGSVGVSQSDMTHYFAATSLSQWKLYPYFDLYDFVKQIGASDDLLKNTAYEVCAAIDELILDSFGGSLYSKFEPGKMGLSFFYPNFSIWDCTWDYMIWNKVSSSGNECYGNLSWCLDNKQTGNWFTLLETWYKE